MKQPFAQKLLRRPMPVDGVQSIEDLPNSLVIPCFALAGAADVQEVCAIMANVVKDDWPLIVVHMAGRRTFDRIMPVMLRIVPRDTLAEHIDRARLSSLYARFV